MVENLLSSVTSVEIEMQLWAAEGRNNIFSFYHFYFLGEKKIYLFSFIDFFILETSTSQTKPLLGMMCWLYFKVLLFLLLMLLLFLDVLTVFLFSRLLLRN